jgi:hypothetical protein
VVVDRLGCMGGATEGEREGSACAVGHWREGEVCVGGHAQPCFCLMLLSLWALHAGFFTGRKKESMFKVRMAAAC